MLLKALCNAWSCHLHSELLKHGLGARILFKDERLVYMYKYKLVQHLTVCFPLLIQALQRNIVVLDWSRQERDHYDAAPCGHLADL